MKTYYSFHPMSVLSLGMGLSPLNPSIAKLPAIDFTEKLLEPAGGTEFGTQLITNSIQMSEAMNFDLSVEASFLAYKAAAKFSSNTSSTFNSDTVTVVLSASTEFGRATLSNFSLGEPAKKVIANNDMARFAETFGTHYVLIERRGVSLSVVLSLMGVKESERTNISAGLELKGGWGPLSAEGKIAFQRELKKATAEGRLDIAIYSAGGTGFSELADLVQSIGAQENSLTNIHNALGKFMKSFTKDTYAPIGFHIRSMEDFYYKPTTDNLMLEQRERKLLRLVEAYRTARQKIEVIESLLSGRHPLSSLVDRDREQKLRDAVSQYERYTYEIARTHEKCLKTPDVEGCDLPPIQMPSDDVIPSPPKLLGGIWVVERDGVALSIDESWKAIITMDSAMGLRRGGGFSGVQAAHPSQIRLIIRDKYVTQVAFRFNDTEVWARQYNGRDQQIVLYYSDIDALKFISDKSGTLSQASGVFYIEYHDMYARKSRLELLDAGWSNSSGRLEIYRYERIPHHVSAPRIEPVFYQQLASYQPNFLNQLQIAGPDRIVAACEDCWDAHKSDCSGFLRCVASKLGIEGMGGDASGIVEGLATSAEWSKLRDGVAAGQAASDGQFVLGGLRGADHQPPRDHGHVVVVVDGPLAKDRYPSAYWGTLGGVGKKNTTINYAWREVDRDRVMFFCRQL